MAKALKTAALVVGAVALVATGVGAAIGAAAAASTIVAGVASLATIATVASVASGVLSLAAGLTAKKPSSDATGSQTSFSADPDAGIPAALGRTGTAGNIVARFGWDTADKGDNDRNAFVSVLSLGPVAEIEPTLGVDRVPVTFDGAGRAIGSYAGFMWRMTQRGLLTGAALTFGTGAGAAPGWTAQHKLSGKAATTWTLRFDTKAKLFQNGVPAPMNVVRGRLVYDPRKDSTYPGGSGSHRMADPANRAAYDAAVATWEYSENPYLHALGFVHGYWQRDMANPSSDWQRVMGMGAPDAGIDYAAYVEGANIADANGWKVGGIIYSGDDKWGSLKKILQAGMGEPLALGAKISCLVNAPKVSLATITADDVVGDCSVGATQPRRDRINTITPRYRLEANNWQLLPGAPLSVAEHVATDKGRRSRTQDYPLIQSTPQVGTAVRYDIENAREFGPIVLPCKLVWMGYKPGDCVTVTLPEVGLNGQTVLLLNRELEPSGGVVTLTARSETAGKHAFALGQTATPPPTPGITGAPIVPVPGEGAWAITGTSITANGVTMPALIISGAVDAGTAQSVSFEYRAFSNGQGADDGWTAAGIENPEVTSKVIVGVASEIAYEVAVRYGARGSFSERRILGPVETAAYQGIKGADGKDGRDGLNGKDGAPGGPGADGQTMYIHYAYANSPDGRVDFELSQPNGRAYEGSYTDFTAADSSDPAAYVWREYKGPPFGLATRGAAVVAGNSIIKNGGSPSWDSDGYSTSGYKNGCYVSFNMDPSGVDLMCGFNTDPTANASYASIDNAWYARSDGSALIYENGNEAGLYVPGYGEGRFAIDYDGRYLRYLYNGELRKLNDIGPGYVFYLDSSLHTPNARIRNIEFGSYPTRASSGITLVADTSTTQIAGNSVRGTGSAGWGSEHVHSREAYSGGASASWTLPPGANTNIMAGLGQGTGSDRGNSFDSITFSIFRDDIGRSDCRINGNQVAVGPTVDLTQPTICRVHYDGLRYVNFWINGARVHQYDWGKQADPLRFIAALASVNPRIDDIVLTPSGANGADGRNGLDGTNGTNGKDGTNGASSFVHLAYADSADGSANFTTGAVGGRAYVGIYRDQIEADSGDYRVYAWSRLRGIDGTNGRDGTPGQPGADGRTPYTHFAYANSPDGSSNFSTDDPSGRTYLGVYTDYTVADSADYRSYSWSLIKGADGAQGPQGGQGPQGAQGPAGISAPQPLALTDLDGTLPAVLVKPGQTITGQVRESFQNNSQSGTVTIQLQYRVGSGGWNYMDQRQANVGPGEPGGVFFSSSYTSQAADDVLVQIRVVSDAPGGTSLRTSSPNYLRAY